MDNKPINLRSFVVTCFMCENWYKICQCKNLNNEIKMIAKTHEKKGE